MAAALNSSNYILLGSSGTLVLIINVSLWRGPPLDQEVSLTYNTGNAGNVLVVDTYTCMCAAMTCSRRAPAIMSQPGQLFAANSGRNDLSVVNIPAPARWAPSPTTAAASSPSPGGRRMVAFGDLSGNGIPGHDRRGRGDQRGQYFRGPIGGERRRLQLHAGRYPGPARSHADRTTAKSIVWQISMGPPSPPGSRVGHRGRQRQQRQRHRLPQHLHRGRHHQHRASAPVTLSMPIRSASPRGTSTATRPAT